jgi:N-acetylglutamate synthase-like GNAT family acetyltransferase
MPAPTSPRFSIRRAYRHELDAVNARYAEVDFLASDTGDLVALAEMDGVAAGLGRIVPVGASAGELGGMLVFDQFKGQGLARRIIAFLLEQKQFNTLYCLPFAELESLYASMGFARTAESADLPAHVAAKYRWCNTHYPKPVLLMRRAVADGNS